MVLLTFYDDGRGSEIIGICTTDFAEYPSNVRGDGKRLVLGDAKNRDPGDLTVRDCVFIFEFENDKTLELIDFVIRMLPDQDEDLEGANRLFRKVESNKEVCSFLCFFFQKRL